MADPRGQFGYGTEGWGRVMAGGRQAARHTASERQTAPALRWVLQGALLVVLVTLSTWGGWLVWQPQTFPLRTMRLTAPVEHVTHQELREVVTPFASAGFVRIDMDGLRAQLEALPWIHHVALKRVWPDVIEVSVTEQVAVARWAQGGLVNEEGEVFIPGHDEGQPELPLFAGPEGTGRLIVEHYRQLDGLAATLGLHLRRVELSERRAWSTETDNGLLLSLGRSDTYPRMQRFVKSYPQTFAARVADIERVDLRYTNGFAIRWRTGVAPAA
ncbi:MAG TPA: cell division protein FtsQ/DivIB [Gammaproteobacteria bacterium]